MEAQRASDPAQFATDDGVLQVGLQRLASRVSFGVASSTHAPDRRLGPCTPSRCCPRTARSVLFAGDPKQAQTSTALSAFDRHVSEMR